MSGACGRPRRGRPALYDLDAHLLIVATVTLGQLDRTSPDSPGRSPDVLGTKIDRLVAVEFAPLTRLRQARHQPVHPVRSPRGLRIRTPLVDKLLTAARDALPMPDAAIARQVLAADLALLTDLDTQNRQAEAGNCASALGHPHRFASPRQVYRSAGLNPIQYESAGKRHDTRISREGSVELRRALIDLGMGLWLNEPAATARAVELRARGKKGGVIACAMAHRANRIAFALVRARSAARRTTLAQGPKSPGVPSGAAGVG